MKLSARKVAIFLLLSFLMGVSLAILPLGCAQYYSPTCTVDASVNYPGAGTLTPGSGSIVYNYGDYVVYTEYTNPGYSFDGWYLNGVYEGQLSSIPITIYMDYQLIAVFSVSSAFLTISSSAGGTTDPEQAFGTIRTEA